MLEIYTILCLALNFTPNRRREGMEISRVKYPGIEFSAWRAVSNVR